MIRAFALLLFASAAVAAPVPKAIKPKAPPLVGTSWVGVHDATASLGTVGYEFKEGGELGVIKRGTASRGVNTWVQEGDTVTLSVNNGYTKYTFTSKDGGYEGTAVNKVGKTWTVKLSPK